jgi:curved DNA-binding protein CbpA
MKITVPNAYDVLGVPLDTTDAQVRARYLELIREFPPEHHPERFAAVRTAYEKLKDLDSRARYRLFEQGSEDTIESITEEAACTTPRRRLGLKQLLTATLPPTR